MNGSQWLSANGTRPSWSTGGDWCVPPVASGIGFIDLLESPVRDERTQPTTLAVGKLKSKRSSSVGAAHVTSSVPPLRGFSLLTRVSHRQDGGLDVTSLRDFDRHESRRRKLHRDDKRIALDQRLHLVVGQRKLYVETVPGGSHARAVEERTEVGVRISNLIFAVHEAGGE
jgi:hypothetical protein